MSREELVKLKEFLFEEYFEKRRHVNSISEEIGIKSGTLMYHIGNFGFTQASYLRHKYSKEFLEQKLESCTFEQLAKELNITPGEFKVLVKNHGIKRDTSSFYKKNIVNPEFYTSDKYEKEFYYFVGLFASDGGFHGKSNMRINIKNKGAEQVLKSLGNIAGHDNIRSYKNDYFELSFTDEGLKEKLISIGIPFESKTYNLKDIDIPNVNCLWSFLNGILDGDGWIASSKSPFGYRTALRYCVCNYNIEFLQNLQYKIKTMLNVETIIYSPIKAKGIPTLQVNARQGSKEFFKTMYEVSPFSLECKKQRYLDIINKVQINEIEI